MTNKILFAFFFIVYTMIIFPIYVLVWCLSVWWDKKRVCSQWCSRVWSKGIYHLRPLWKVYYKGVEKIDKNTTYLIISNHQSMLDIPLILHLNKNFRWVSKKEVYNIPIFGWVLWMRGDVAIQRGGAASAKKMIKDCRKLFDKKISVSIFPEGTRTTTGEIGELHSGAFLIAKRGGVPVLPVVINGNYDCLKRDKIGWKQGFTISVLDPITVDEIADSTMEELRDKVSELLNKEYKIICQK